MSYMTISSLSLMLIALISVSSAEQEALIRRLTGEEDEPTKQPTESPTNQYCVLSYIGGALPEIVNPSDLAMGLINSGTESIDQSDIDLESTDTYLDADNAKAFCELKFGAGSKPVTPTTPERYNAMVNVCEALGGGNQCYMGLYREDYNNGQTACDEWRGEEAGFKISSTDIDTDYGNGWANNQPTCPFDTQHVHYDVSPTKHCVAYKTNTNKLVVQKCTNTMHIICEFNTECNP